MPKRAAVYCRISRDRVGAGLGVDRQQADCVELAERLGWTVAAVYTDNDLSAYSGKRRPGYRDMLAAIETGTVDAVLAWHTDRLHRSPSELEEYVTLCEARGVPTHTVKAGEMDLATPSGRMVARMLGAAARHEVEHNAERMVRAKDQARSEGRWLGGRRPFGYEPDGVTLREAEAAVIRDATTRVLAGQSLRSVAALLNRDGVKTSAGNSWSSVTLRDVLLRGRNAGLHTHKGKPTGPATWPAIVTEDEWLAVTAILTDPERVTTIPRQSRFLGTGLYRCGECQATVFVTTVGARGSQPKRSAYRCSATRAHVACSADRADDYVNTVVTEYLAVTGGVPAQPGEDETPALRGELAVVRARLDQVADQFADGFDPRQVMRINTRLRQRESDVEQQLAVLAARGSMAAMIDPADPAASWQAMTVAEKRAALRNLFAVTVNKTAQRGRMAGGGYFDTGRITVTPLTDAP